MARSSATSSVGTHGWGNHSPWGIADLARQRRGEWTETLAAAIRSSCAALRQRVGGLSVRRARPLRETRQCVGGVGLSGWRLA
ncbi:MAG: hypothetical protein R3F11_18145 [Verrucomicrobiales bacterium]